MSDLNGTWRHGDDTIVFDEDTLILGRGSFLSWHEDGDCLTIVPAQAQIVVPYRCEGDTLHLDVDGVVSVWSRVVDV